VISKILIFLYLENMVINCHWTCQRVKSLPQQQTRKDSNICHKPNLIYLDLKKFV